MSKPDRSAISSRSAVSGRRILFWLHIWIGLALGLPFALLGITGSILVYEQQIEDLLSPAPQATGTGAMQPAQAIIDAALSAKPGTHAQILNWPRQPGDAAMVRVASAGGRDATVSQVLVDPVSLQILDTREGFRTSFMRTVHQIHGNMLIDGREGRAVIGWFGVGMLALGLSGIVLWWPKASWRGAYGVKKEARGWLLYCQIHGTVGITAWALFVVLSFTGIAIAFPQTVSSLVRTVLTEGPSTAPVVGPGAPQIHVTPVEGAARVDADAAVAVALKDIPRATLVSIFLAQGREQPIRVNLLPENATDGSPAISVAVDPYRGEVVNVREPWAGDLGDDVMTWQRPLHTGRGLSGVYKLAIFAVGLLPLLFALTGIAMWWSKRRTRFVMREHAAVIEGLPAE